MIKKSSRKVLVTGGGGFLGSAIVRALVKRGDEVSSISRSSYPELENLGVEQTRGDIGDALAVGKACKNKDIVFHTAAKGPPWGRYTDYYSTNVIGTQNVLDGCIQQQVSRLVYSSTPSVVFNGGHLEGVDESFPYPEKYNTFYSETKATAERKVVKAGQDKLLTISIRPHRIWGPGDTQILPRIVARAKKLKQIGDGTNLMDTTYIDNAVDAHLLAADRLAQNPELSGRIYIISDDDPIPAWEMINAFLKAAGIDPIKGQISAKTVWIIGAIMEFVYRLLRLPGEPFMTRFMAETVSTTHWSDISAAKKDLGYAPKISIKEGLRRLEAWLRSEEISRESDTVLHSR